jgi:hypothetical protein
VKVEEDKLIPIKNGTYYIKTVNKKTLYTEIIPRINYQTYYL